MISIPLSLAIGVTLLDLTGFSINQLSIVGAVIALGLLVDDSIVVVENITRFLREGHTRREAAILATRQIAIAVLGCTATLIVAFLPLLVLPGLPGQVHPIVAGRRGLHRGRLAPRVSHDHSVAGQPAAQPARGTRRQPRSPGADPGNRPHLRADAEAGPAPSARDADRGDWRIVVGRLGAGTAGRLLALPQGRDAAVPGRHPHAARQQSRRPPIRRRDSPNGCCRNSRR